VVDEQRTDLRQSGKRFGIASFVGCLVQGVEKNLLAFFELLEGGEVLQGIGNPSVQKSVT
jgi:hypothetical protein